MANANTNILSIDINVSATSTGSNSRSALSSKYSSSGKGDFNSALSTATDRINRQAQPAANPSDAEEIQYTEAGDPNPKMPVESKNTQGQNQQPQDAPQNVQPVEKNIPAEIPAVTENVPAEIPTENLMPQIELPADIPADIVPAENSPQIPIQPQSETEIPDELPTLEISDAPIFFAPNTETLLPVQPQEKSDAPNLMAVMPQPDDNKAQTMLNILSGKTWTAEDVQATLTAQNQQPVANPADALNLQQNAKNFTLNPNQNPNPNPNPNPEQPLAKLNQFQNVNLNAEQSPQIQTQPQVQNVTPNPTQNPAQVQVPTQAQVQPQIQAQPVILQQTQTQLVQEQIQAQLQTEPQTQPIVNSLQPQIQPNQINQPQPISELLGANLSLEDNQPVAPLSPVQETLRQQPEHNQQQPQNQNLQQNLSQNISADIQSQPQSFGVEDSFAQNLAPAIDNVSSTQPATQTQNPEAAAQTARENQSVPAQIVEQARLIRNAENTEMVINLKPEHLGQLTLRVSVSQNGAVNASFYSDSAQVRAAIENSIVQLKQELNDQGLKVENVQVYAGLTEGGLTNGQGGQAWQQQQQHGRRINFENLQEEVDAVTPLNENISTDGVDYKI